MPQIIDYSLVCDQMREQGFQSLYYNSGAFGFPKDVTTHIRGWIGEADSTLRESARPFIRNIPAPYVANMVSRLARIWRENLPGVVWVLPMSHWSYELDFGSRDWLPLVLQQIQIDTATLIHRNNGAAIAFSTDEVDAFILLITSLLENLQASDFAVFLPNHPVMITLHHHKQIWWVCADQALSEIIDAASA